MCRLLAAELFLRCQHIQPCHLKHPLQRCHAPRGQRFRNPDAATNPGRVPSRACPEEHWRTATIEVDGYCPACTQQREETRQLLQSSFNQGETGDDAGDENENEDEDEDTGLEEQQIAGEVKEYSCGHRRVRMDPAVLQRFSDDPDPDAEDQHERGAAREHAGDDTRAIESCLRWDKLRLRCESCPERCAECRLRASGLCIQTTVRVNPGFI